MSDPEEAAAEFLEARLAKVEQQTEWLSVELANLKNALVSMVTVASEGLLPEP